MHGRLDDYQAMRFGLTSTLMNDGFFSYSELDRSYQSIPWFDEYDIHLGKAVERPQRVPWQNGVYRREFENGVVLVNPNAQEVTLNITEALVRFKGPQAPMINNGKSVDSTLTLPARDGIILLKQNTN